MSTIVKVGIRGVRSFYPEAEEVMEFYSPVTMILGANGCGKTTIIECLKFGTTGTLPPNSNSGKSFVHDPKLAQASEVKAQIKVRFCDGKGRQVQVIRSMEVKQQKSKVAFKQIDGLIRTRAGGETSSIPHKCGELDSIVPMLMGVSKPILESVIFCHQEESSWPLQDGATLKKKFDEIFSSARYTKALTEIRKQKQELSMTSKDHAGDVKELGEAKRTAAGFERLRREARKVIEDASRQTEILEAKKATLESRSEEIEGIERRSAEFDRKLQVVRLDVQNLTREVESLGERAEELMEESDEELVALLESLEEQEGKTQHEEEAAIAEKAELEDEAESVRKATARLADRRGGLKVMKENCERDVAAVGEDDRGMTTSLEEAKEAAEREEKEVQKALDVAWDAARSGVATKQSELEEARRAQREIASEMERARATAHLTTTPSITEARVREAEEKYGAAQSELAAHRAKQKAETSRCEAESRSLDAEVRRLDAQASAEREALEQSQAHEEERRALMVAEANLASAREKVSSSSIFLSSSSSFRADPIGARAEVDDSERAAKEAREALEARRYELRIAKSELKPPIGEAPLDSLDEFRCNYRKLQRAVFEKGYGQKMLEADKQAYFADTELLGEASGANLMEYVDRAATVVRNFEAGVLRLDTFLRADATAAAGYLAKLGKHDACPLCKQECDGETKKALAKSLSSKASVYSAERWDDYKRRIAALRERDFFSEARAWAKAKALEGDREAAEARARELEAAVDDLGAAVEARGQAVEAAREALRVSEEAEQLRRAEREAEADLEEKKSAIARLGEKRSVREIQDAIGAIFEAKARAGEKKAANDKLCTDLIREESRLAQRERDRETEATRSRNAWTEKRAVEKRKEDARAELATLQATKSSQRERVYALEKEVASLEASKHKTERDLGKKRDDARREADAARAAWTRFRDRVDAAERAKIRLAETDEELAAISREYETLASREADARSELQAVDAKLKFLQLGDSNLSLARRKLTDNIQLRRTRRELEAKQNELRELKGQRDEDYMKPVEIAEAREEISDERADAVGRITVLATQRQMSETVVRENTQLLKQKRYKDVDERFRLKTLEHDATEMAIRDLDLYWGALDKALVSYHRLKITEINKHVAELWQATYQGSDIDKIEIVSGEESGSSRATRSYNYHVQMTKSGSKMDMKGRCSAGQRVLASIVIRLALAQSFGVDGCGLLCLDEPTTNLDDANRASLARGLAKIIAERSKQRNFQLVVITHDETFITTMRTELATTARVSLPDYYFRVDRVPHDSNFRSTITKCDIQDLV
ncbi:hypothetical protein CTAYLR_000939 [Chrysophaeum taylorii]|uniref:Rad50/SbcC-type AAA domain-containing protein n=1 Tax=Chrysophaeum taylorii TaxID=2483200 RepID=A0AAD7UH26_9STRA|nr:hypothetical protein CTAYLR_000939 [Chrysophaeum taylorii]